MRFAIIKDGIVQNIIKADQKFLDENNLFGVEIAPDECVEIGSEYVDGVFIKQTVAPIPINKIIFDKIQYYQSVSPKLLTELYVANTLSGISTAQSDQMFDEFQDILVRIKEGAFPTALYRLNAKVPSGFVTQELIDTWKTKIINYMT